MLTKLRTSAHWFVWLGTAAMLIGLAWDALLHRLDPGLAAREGVFSTSNPAHIFLGGGIGSVAFGVALGLWNRGNLATAPRARWANHGAGLAIVALAVAGFGAGLTGESSLTAAHSHNAALPGADASNHPHDDPSGADGPLSNAAVKAGVTHSHGEAAAVTAAELRAAQELVDAVRAGTARLADFAAARSEGYIQITASQSGLAHYLNPAYFGDSADIDPARPESLMYYRMPSGERKLVGVMFLMPPGVAGPRIGGPLTSWHAHDNLCHSLLTGIVAALTDANGQCPSGTIYRGVTPEMMHVWLIDNPGGVFGDEMEPATIARTLGITP